MEKATNINASYYARNLIEFKGSNLKGEFLTTYVLFNETSITDKIYCIYSYNTMIFANVNGKWIKNIKKYSITTSKQTTQLNIFQDDFASNECELKDKIKENCLFYKLNKELSNNNTNLTKKLKV